MGLGGIRIIVWLAFQNLIPLGLSFSSGTQNYLRWPLTTTAAQAMIHRISQTTKYEVNFRA